MTLRAAAEQALEALQATMDETNVNLSANFDARNALRAALAAEQPQPVSAWHAVADWLRDNYQDHPTISDLCDAMRAAAPPLPAAAPNADVLLLRETFALCEATEDECANADDAFKRGRAFEAKRIRRGIGTWYQDTFCGRSHMGEPVPAAPPPPAAAEQPQPVGGWRLVPVEPTAEHIDSIAMRYSHDFGLLPENQQENLRAFARQMYEECSGQGFYRIAPPPPAAAPTVTDAMVEAACKAYLDTIDTFRGSMRAAIDAALAAKGVR